MNDPAPATPTYELSAIDRLDPPARGLIIDMDGVLWRDAMPIGDLERVFSVIAARGLALTAATNNATKSSEEYSKRLQGFGVGLHPERIVTSAEATARTLQARYPQSGRVFVVGEEGVVGRLQGVGFEVITDPRDDRAVVAVVVGLDRALTYQKLNVAARHVRGGAFFCGTNPDPTFPTPDGLIPGAGSIVAAVAAAAEVAPTFVGKPSPLLFDIAAQRMGMSKVDVLVVGDRLATDIAGGQAWGARTALVLSGVSSAAEASAWRPEPDIIASSLAELVGA